MCVLFSGAWWYVLAVTITRTQREREREMCCVCLVSCGCSLVCVFKLSSACIGSGVCNGVLVVVVETVVY